MEAAASMLSQSSFTTQLASLSSSASHTFPSRSNLSVSTPKSGAHCSRDTQGNRIFIVMASAASSDGKLMSSNDGPTASAGPIAGRASSAIDFLTLCQRLKTTKRTGWVNHGLKETESIADHMYRMAVMAIISSDVPGINRDRCVKMAVIHDIAEAIVGDITPSDGIPKEEKSRRERAAIDEMCNLLGGGHAAEEVKDLWLEYENNSSPEANLVKDLDKVEMILQALEYETSQGKVLNDFYESTAGKFQTVLGKAWAAEITTRRKKRMGVLHD